MVIALYRHSPITTTVCPRRSGSRWMGEGIVTMLMVSSDSASILLATLPAVRKLRRMKGLR